MEAVMGTALASRRFTTVLLGWIAALALLLHGPPWRHHAGARLRSPAPPETVPAARDTGLRKEWHRSSPDFADQRSSLFDAVS
jgi:hypothetical protein